MEKAPPLGQSEPPSLVKTTHYSIELSWGPSPQPPAQEGSERPCYAVQEEDLSKSPSCGYITVYRGYSTSHVFTELKSSRQYQYRMKSANDSGESTWSDPITVTTADPPISSENLHKAVQRGNAKMVSSILTSCPNYVNLPNIVGLSPLMSACASGKADVVQVLLDKEADINFRNSSGRTCLMEACYHGNQECAGLVISHDASSCQARDYSGFSVLHYAVDGGNVDLINFILNQGLPVDDVDSSTLSGWTPLMRLASLGGSGAVARVLLERGADVNRRDSEGNTVLMLASLNGFSELVRVLLNYEADILVRTEHGKTALDFATSFNRKEVSELLRSELMDRGSSSKSVDTTV